MNDEPKPNDPLGEQADRLERALRELEERKKSAAALAEKMAPERERQAALHAQLEKLPQHERRKVLDAIGQKRVSAAPKPLEPVRASGYMPRPAVPAEPPAVVKWRLWVNMPQVQLWEAVALVLGIEPGSLKHSETAWMAGPGRGPFFEPRSFPSPAKRTEFDDALLLAERAANASGPIHLRTGLAVGMNKRTAMVLLCEVVGFFVGCDWPAIPAPLLAILKSTAPVAPAVPVAPETPPAPASEPAAVKPPGKRWTPEALEELREHRTKHGTKAAAERFGISDARVRELLPSDNPPPRGFSAFNPRM